MDESQDEEITTLVGREVYSTNGVFVGEIEDIRLNLDERSVTDIALTEVNRDLFADRLDGHRGVLVPYRWVRAVGDVVLVNDVIERFSGPEEEEEAAI